MTGTIPRVALLKPDPRISDDISHLFLRHEYSLRSVVSVDEIIELEQDESSGFDVIVVPLQLSDGSSGITACLRIKSEESLAARPVLGLSVGKEKTIIQAFYEVGADIIICGPFDADLMYLQISAMGRQAKSFAQSMRSNQESSGLSRSLVTAFDSVREGLLIFNSNYELSFSNVSARLLLGTQFPPTNEDALQVEKIFRPYMVEHEKSTSSTQSADEMGSSYEATVNRIGGRNFAVGLRLTTLIAHDGVPIGTAVALTDLSELDQLSNTLTQAQRTRTLGLLAAGCSLQFLSQTGSTGGVIVSPVMRLEEFIQNSPKECFVNISLTTLLEFLDLVISPDISVKVNTRSDVKLAIRPADFFQLAGHMLLHAVEYAGRAGEALLDVGDNIPGEGVTLVVTARSRKVTPFLANDHLSSLIQGELSTLGKSGRSVNKLSYGLTAAQEVADRYRTAIELQGGSGGILKIRVRLPASYK
jgi:DNA-binding response OmpR family regulator